MVAIGQVVLGGAIAGVGGGVGLTLARREWQTRTELKNAQTAQTGALGPGVVELAGAARPAEKTFTSPLTGQECLAYDYTVEKRRTRNRSNEGTSKRWVTVTDEQRAAPFYVDDGSGQALVDAPVADLELERAYEVDSDDVPSGAIDQVVATVTGDTGPDAPVTDERLAEIREGGPRRRYRERLILPGESVYVYGEAMAPRDVGPTGGGVGTAVSSLVTGDASVVEAATTAFGGGREQYRRAKRGGSRQTGATPEQQAQIESMRESAQQMQDRQHEDRSELTPEERRQMTEMAQQATSMLGTAGSNAVGPDREVLGSERLVVSRGESIGEFVVSDREKGQVLRSYSTSALQWAVGGAGSVAVGGGLVALGLGLL